MLSAGEFAKVRSVGLSDHYLNLVNQMLAVEGTGIEWIEDKPGRTPGTPDVGEVRLTVTSKTKDSYLVDADDKLRAAGGLQVAGQVTLVPAYLSDIVMLKIKATMDKLEERLAFPKWAEPSPRYVDLV